MVKERPVFMSVSFRGERVMLGTGIKTDFYGWDPGTQRVKQGYPGSFATNNWLDALEETALSTWRVMQDSPSEERAEQFRALFQEIKPRYSGGYFDAFYKFMESGSARWSIATYKKVRTIYKHLREYESWSGKALTFMDMGPGFPERFRTFYREKGNGDSTTFKAVNIIVWFLNWATDQGYNVQLAYRKFYKTLGKPETVSRVYLSLRWSELEKIREHEPATRKMERARDMFLFMCYSGIRFSQIQSLKKQDVDVNSGIVTVRRPGGKDRKISMGRHAREIYARFENRYYPRDAALPSLSIITLNKYLRTIARESGLDRLVPAKEAKTDRDDPRGRGDQYNQVPLHERLTAGMAVHTFIANANEMGISPEIGLLPSSPTSWK